MTVSGWPADPLAAARGEIERLHAFIAAWFRGERSREQFAPEFADRLHEAFHHIQPAGTLMGKADLVGPIEAAHGANPSFRIEVRDVALVGAWPGAGLILSSYVEAQAGALNSRPPENLRRSTVLFEAVEGRLVWRHLQETALPAG